MGIDVRERLGWLAGRVVEAKVSDERKHPYAMSKQRIVRICITFVSFWPYVRRDQLVVSMDARAASSGKVALFGMNDDVQVDRPCEDIVAQVSEIQPGYRGGDFSVRALHNRDLR